MTDEPTEGDVIDHCDYGTGIIEKVFRNEAGTIASFAVKLFNGGFYAIEYQEGDLERLKYH